MKYAAQVLDLMAAYPGRDFRMLHIVRYVAAGRSMELKERRAMRKAVFRVLEALQETGVILIRPPSHKRGGYAVYRWKGEAQSPVGQEQR